MPSQTISYLTINVEGGRSYDTTVSKINDGSNKIYAYCLAKIAKASNSFELVN